MTTTRTIISPAAKVLLAVPYEHRSEVGLHMNLIQNTLGGRPSDAARRAVADYERLGIDGLRVKHRQDRDDALSSCPCIACRAESQV